MNRIAKISLKGFIIGIFLSGAMGLPLTELEWWVGCLCLNALFNVEWK